MENQTKTISKPQKTQSVCEVYQFLKHNIYACGELSLQLLMDFEMLMPHKRLTRILKNREEYFAMYPEKKDEFKKKVIEDLEANKPKDA